MSKYDHSPLNKYELEAREQAKTVPIGDPPLPWKRQAIFHAAGIFSGGWYDSIYFVLMSGDGYSVNDTSTHERILFNQDPDLLRSNLTRGGLGFKIAEYDKEISVFGDLGGDGIHKTNDSWSLELIYPWWPQGIVTIRKYARGFPPKSRYSSMQGIRLDLYDDGGYTKMSFNEIGDRFAILRRSGVEIFSRDK